MTDVADVIFVDIDRPFDWLEHNREWLESHAKWLLSRLGYNVIKIEFKKSTNGNIHMYVYVDKKIESHEERLHLMHALGCDLGLVAIAYARLKIFGDPLIRHFAVKKRCPKHKS